MALKLITAPTEEPVTLAEAKLHLRVTSTADDALITSLIKAAREYCEAFTGRQFCTATYQYILDDFPARREPPSLDVVEREIVLPKPPIQSVAFLSYLNESNTTTTLYPSGNYIVDGSGNNLFSVDTSTEPGRIYPVYGQMWPFVTTQLNCVIVQFIAGYGAASAVPESIKAAMKLLIGNWYENREATISGTIITDVPKSVDALLWANRVLRFDA